MAGLLDVVLASMDDVDECVAMERLASAARAILGARLALIEVDDHLLTRLRDTSDDLGPPAFQGGTRGVLKQIRAGNELFAEIDTTRFGDPTARDERVSIAAPIVLRTRIIGQLRVIAKTDGSEFTKEDRTNAELLANVVAAVLTRVLDRKEQERRELFASKVQDVTNILLTGGSSREVLRLIAKGGWELARADESLVFLLVRDAPETLVVQAAQGERFEAIVGQPIRVDGSFIRDVIVNGTPVILDDASAEALGDHRVPLTGDAGPAMFFPLVLDGVASGALAVARYCGRSTFDETDISLVETFVGQVNLALQAEHARRKQEWLAVLRDEERIARDLHDKVIQQIFATGIVLQSTVPRINDPDVASRVLHAVDELDRTIRDIRSTIFALQSTGDDHSLRSAIVRLASEIGASCGLRTHIDIRSPLDIPVGSSITSNVLATLQEALANVARHANASEAEVTLVIGPEILLTVSDNGVGIPADVPRLSGLRNLDERVRALGGTMVMRRRPEGGSVLEWRVPLDRRTEPPTPASRIRPGSRALGSRNRRTWSNREAKPD